MKLRIDRRLLAVAFTVSVSACTTVSVDQVQLMQTETIIAGESIVVLGRHHSAEFETEPSLISCVGQKLANRQKQANVISASKFVDAFYPYFEARTAPLTLKRLEDTLAVPIVQQRVNELGLRYMVWIEGSTERTGAAGSMSCALTPGGGGCFGFGTWEDTSDYEAVVWDVQRLEEVGRVSTEAIGTSYMPAVIVPLPLVARVQANACEGMGTQLANFFDGEANTLKTRPIAQ